jgi:hypothetical protein
MEKPAEGEGKPDADEKDEQIGKLSQQVENLTKGIASYRDEAKAATEASKVASEAATRATNALSEFQNLFTKKEKGSELTDEEEKKLATYAQKHGLVSKADLDKQKNETFVAQVKAFEDQAVAEFLEANPEYDNDDKWKEVMGQFVLFRQPTTLAGYRAILQKIHKDISGDEKKDAEGRARAAIINRSKLGLGGGRQSNSADEAEAKIDSLHKRYPHLSRETIVERLSEIESLPSKKK